MLKTCAVCGEPTEHARCSDHQLPARHRDKAPREQRGYDSAWQRLSKRARKLQPWCSHCGTHHDLTTDHLHWPARTLEDVDVLCRSCNAKKGKADGRDDWKQRHGTGAASYPGGMTLDPGRTTHRPQPSSSTQFVPTSIREVV